MSSDSIPTILPSTALAPHLSHRPAARGKRWKGIEPVMLFSLKFLLPLPLSPRFRSRLSRPPPPMPGKREQGFVAGVYVLPSSSTELIDSNNARSSPAPAPAPRHRFMSNRARRTARSTDPRRTGLQQLFQDGPQGDPAQLAGPRLLLRQHRRIVRAGYLQRCRSLCARCRGLGAPWNGGRCLCHL